ncbi:MAG TPA: cation:proton antiporter [Gemmatimonadaceae bacterium]|jgi:CPA2 family monovalent cation:H+ antiporter-2|nr:cation:proton antiporter [Gemmatimonadaceae bacterium]
MHDAHAFLQNLALVLCVAAVTTVLFHRLRQPVVFGYLLAGMIVGPYVPLPLAADENIIRTLSELGVILLMFSLGLEFSIRRVAKLATTSGLGALAETSLMFGLGYVAAGALGLEPLERVFAGAMVAISSTTIIANAFAERGVRGRVRDTVFGILIIEDLIAILLVATLTAVAAGGGLSPAAFATTVVRLVMFLVGLIMIGLLVVPRTIRGVVEANRNEMTLLWSVGICFAAALLAAAFGYSVALGAFIAGSLVAESGDGQKIEHLVQPLKDLFVAMFFVSAGMLIDPRVLVEQWPVVATLSLVVIGGKIIAVTVGAFLAGNGLRASVFAGMSLAQIGEFSFIIAAIGTSAGAIRGFLYPVAVAVSAITTLFTPWLIRAAGPTASFVDRKLPKPIQTFVALYGTWVARLSAPREGAGGQLRVRRLVRLVILDALLLALLIIGSALERDRFATVMRTWTDVSEDVSQILVFAGTVAIAVPLVVGLVRVAWRLALVLAIRALPTPEKGVDFAQAPRTAFVTTLHIGILLAVGVPLFVLAQLAIPEMPGSVLALVALGIFAVAFWRSARNLHGHVRAGAQIIVSALAQNTFSTDEELSKTMEHVSAALPGLGEPTPVVLHESSHAVGRTLAELNLRGLTGATILAISRPSASGEEQLVPTGRDRLRAGDVLALAGSNDAVANARELLDA